MDDYDKIALGVLIGVILGALLCVGFVYFWYCMFIPFLEYLYECWQDRGGGWRMRARNKHRKKIGLPKLKSL